MEHGVAGARPGRPSNGRAMGDLPVEGLVAALASVGRASDLVEALDFGTALLARLGDGQALGCLLEGGRLRVVRHPGLERDALGELVGHDAFRRLVADWRDRPVPPERAVPLDLGDGRRLVCAPIATDRWLGLVAAPRRDPRFTEMLEGLAGHVANVGYRLDADHALERSRAELGAVVQAVPHPVVAVDAGGCLSHVNPAACELFGVSGSFDLGRHVAGLLHAPAVEALLLGQDDRFECEVSAGRPPRAWRAVAAQVVHRGSHATRFVTLEDLTTVRDSVRVKDDFVAVVGHELRTPLTVISGFAQTLAARGDSLDDEQRQQFLTAIANQSGRLGQVVEDLLFLSMERRGRVPSVVPGAVDLERLVQALVSEFRLREPDRPVEVVVTGQPVVDTDRSMVEQAMRHLLDNAVKFSEGRVTVEVSGGADAVSVTVADEGPGIFSGDLPRVYEPFVQLDGSSTRRHGGAGVGLYVATRVAELLGGTIECDSRLGVGSRFSLVLPRRLRPQPAPPVGSTPSHLSNA